jgi:TldD protein
MLKIQTKTEKEADWEEKKSIVDYISSKLKKADYYEIRLVESKGDSILMNNGNIEAVGFGDGSGIGVRYILNGCVGFFSTNFFSKEKVDETIERSLKINSKIGELGKKTKFSKEKIEKADYTVNEKKKIDEIDIKEKIEYIKGIDSSLLESQTKLISRMIYYSDEKTKKMYLNSEGSRIESEIPRIDIYYRFAVSENGSTLQRYWQNAVSGGFEKIEEKHIDEKIKKEAIALKRNIIEGVQSPKGMLEVIVSPEITGIMAHESVGHPYEADRILGRESAQAGESFVEPAMLGSRIGNTIVNVVDDPTVEFSYGFYLYDDEGVKARRKYLIKNGIINEFLHNRETAYELNTHSNGSARAVSSHVEPIIRMSNTFVLPMDYKEEELIQETKFGIYIKNFTEWNIDDKRLNQKYKGNEAYLIENGEITKPIRQPSIEITTPALWSSVIEIADNLELHAATCGKGEPMQGIPVTMGGPSMKLKIRIN